MSEPEETLGGALRWAVDHLADAMTSTGGPAAASPAPPAAWPLDASMDHVRYREWLARGRVGRALPPERWSSAPNLARRWAGRAGVGAGRGAEAALFSVVVPVYRPDLWYLRRCVESVRAQRWGDWELCLCDDGSGNPELGAWLRRLTRWDRRVRVTANPRNLGISAATNRAMALASGQFVALVDHDDELAPDALASMAAAIEANGAADVLYSDEDKLDEEGRPFGPRFKPDWSPDYLLTTPYLGHLVMIRRSLLDSLGGMRPELDGAQDYDLMLRATEQARAVVHVPEVLYHWRIVSGSAAGDATAKPWAYAATQRALASALERRGDDGRLTPGPMPGMWHVRRPLARVGPVVVSVVVSTVGGAGRVRACVDAVLRAEGVGPVEVLLAPPPYPDLETQALLGALARDGVATLGGGGGGAAAMVAQGSLLAFVDARVEPLDDGWLRAMAEHAQRPEIGAVGARLLSPDGRVRHVGLVLGLGGPAGAVLEGLPSGEHGYLEAAVVTRNWSAVWGACLMTRTSLFESLGGWDQDMGPWADVDYCLRLGQAGYRVLVTPLAELVHHGRPGGREASAGAIGATGRFLGRWEQAIRAGDPFFSPNLSRLGPAGVLPDDHEDQRWNDLISPLQPSSPR